MNARSVPVLLICAAVFVACGRKGGDAESASDGIPVRVEKPRRMDIIDSLKYGATLLPSAEVKLFSTVPDRILSFPVEDGDYVDLGQVVALVRREGLERGLDQYAAQIAALDAQIANLESEVKRAGDLLDKGVMTRQAYDKADTALKAQKAQRRALLAGRGQLAVSAGNAVIKAPIGGVFAGKMLQEGDMAVPQVPLGRIMVMDPLKALLRVVERDVAKVRVGMAVSLKLDAHPGRVFTGRVERIAPYLDPATRTNAVEVSVPNPRDPSTGAWPAKPGMYGVAEMVTGRKKDALVVPSTALLLENSLLEAGGKEKLRRVFVAGDDGLAHARTVSVGSRSGNVYEVLSGLTDQDMVVVRGQHSLKDGQKVDVQAGASGGGGVRQ